MSKFSLTENMKPDNKLKSALVDKLYREETDNEGKDPITGRLGDRNTKSDFIMWFKTLSNRLS